MFDKSVTINIGSGGGSFWVKPSLFLLKWFKLYPNMPYAIEESLRCAELGYYGAGIIVFSQILNLMKVKTPYDRKLFAHQILKKSYSRTGFNEMKTQLKKLLEEKHEEEMLNRADSCQYLARLESEWKETFRVK